MAERIVEIGTSAEVLNRFLKEALQNPAIARLISDKDSKSVEDALIEGGLMQKGDHLAVSFVADAKVLPGTVSKKAKIYNAREVSKGKPVATSFIGEFDLDIEFDRDN